MKHSVTIAQNIITYIAQVTPTRKSALMCNMLMTGYHNNKKIIYRISFYVHSDTSRNT